MEIDNIQSMHHTHIWSLEGEHHVFTTHLKLKQIDNYKQVLEVKNATKNILEKYRFSHYTIETEFDDETCNLL